MRCHALSLLLSALAATSAVAQEVADDVPEARVARDALERCTTAAEAGRHPDADHAADEAWTRFEAWASTRPDDPEPLVGQAQVLLQCRIAFASFMEQGALSARAAEILRAALALDAAHWTARFLLAVNWFHNPEFMGLTDDAIREFETLLAQQGDRTDAPELAAPYGYLGDLYLRVGRTEDARAIWEKGAALFPDDDRFAERLGAAAAGEAEPQPAPSGASGGASSDSTAASDVAYEMEPLVVTVDGGYAMDDARQQATLSKLDVYMAPGGTADILQVFQMLPGVTRVGEGSDLYVRGGDPAESPVFVEGARLLHAGVFETLHGSEFGILDPSVLKRAYFSSGGFSARWGDALSGIVALETDGAPTMPAARAGLNVVGGGATWRSPLGSRGGAWTAVRAMDTSLLLSLYDETDEYPVAPRSIEGVAGLTFAPRPALEIKAVGLVEGDVAAREIDAHGWRGPFESRGSIALALVSARVIDDSGAAALRATASWNRRGTDFGFGVLERDRADDRLELRIEGDLGASEARQLRFGFEAARLSSHESGRVPTSERVAPASPAESIEERDATGRAGAFLEGEARPLPGLALVAGARVDRLPGEDAATFDPRLAIAWRKGDWTWRLGGGTFQQGRWRIGYELPDEGAPAGTPRRARHVALAVERDGRPAIRIETYAKSYDRYAPERGALEIEAGSARGVDALVRWAPTERWGGWMAYSYLQGTLDLSDGGTTSSPFDVTHSLTAVGTYAIRGWQIGGTARFATGRPYTPVVGPSPGSEPPGPAYGDPLSRRLASYVRLDARLTRFQRIAGRLAVFYLEALNVLDRPNASSVVYDENWENPRTVGSFFSDRTLVLGVEIDLR